MIATILLLMLQWQDPMNMYKSELHLHGSLSEGWGNMSWQTEQAKLNGYDVLWWADHMERNASAAFPQEIDLTSSLSQGRWVTPDYELVTRLVDLDWGGPDYRWEAGSLRLEWTSPRQDWHEVGFQLDVTNNLHRSWAGHYPALSLVQCLEAPPVGDAGFLVRMRCSAVSTGLDKWGEPRLLEWVPSGLPVPPAGPHTTRIFTPPLGLAWDAFVAAVAQDGLQMGLGLDFQVYGVELVFYARQGGSIALKWDSLKWDCRGPMDVEAFQAQAAKLQDPQYGGIRHHVGTEIAGPATQNTGTVWDDHIVSLTPGGTIFIDWTSPLSQPHRYPVSAIEAIHVVGGVAILAHPFGTAGPGDPLNNNQTAKMQGTRVVQSRWEVDCLEVYYKQRGRLEQDFLRLWDECSKKKLYYTGVGTSDNHNVMPWEDRVNNGCTWIISDSDDDAALLAALRSGQAWWGAQTEWNPQSVPVFQQVDGVFGMGNVVPLNISGDRPVISAQIPNMPPNHALVVIDHAGVAHVTSQPSFVETFGVHPGGFLRLEVRDSTGETVFGSNPIYFIGAGETPPPHRAP